MAYRAVQHVTAIFDHAARRIQKKTCSLQGADRADAQRIDHYHTRGGGGIESMPTAGELYPFHRFRCWSKKLNKLGT